MNHVTFSLAVKDLDEFQSLVDKVQANLLGYTFYNSLASEKKYRDALNKINIEGDAKHAREVLDECAIREIQEIDGIKQSVKNESSDM